MGNIDYMCVEKFLAAKISEGLSPKKIRDAVSAVSLVMKCAVRSNARKDNPAAGHQIRVVKRKLRPGDMPDMADIKRLVAHVRDPYKPAAWFRQEVIRPALRAAGLPETLGTYDLRHNHASLLIEQGANVLAIAQRMGPVPPRSSTKHSKSTQPAFSPCTAPHSG